MKRLTSTYALAGAASLLAISLSGCGGENTDTGNDTRQFDGLYSGTYNRATGTTCVSIDSSNAITVTVFDDTEGTYVGTTSLNNNGTFSLVATNEVDNTTINVTGMARGSNSVNQRRVDLSCTGEFSLEAELSRRGNVGRQIFSGTYAGAFTGSTEGNFLGTVNSDGSFSGSAFVGDDSVNLTGNVSQSGHVNFRGSRASINGGVDYVFRGVIVVTGGEVQGRGLWTATGGLGTGTWSIERS